MAVTYAPQQPNWADYLNEGLTRGTSQGLEIGRTMLAAKSAKNQEVLDRLNAQRIQQVMRLTDVEEGRQVQLHEPTLERYQTEAKAAKVDLSVKEKLAAHVDDTITQQHLANEATKQRMALELQATSEKELQLALGNSTATIAQLNYAHDEAVALGNTQRADDYNWIRINAVNEGTANAMLSYTKAFPNASQEEVLSKTKNIRDYLNAAALAPSEYKKEIVNKMGTAMIYGNAIPVEGGQFEKLTGMKLSGLLSEEQSARANASRAIPAWLPPEQRSDYLNMIMGSNTSEQGDGASAKGLPSMSPAEKSKMISAMSPSKMAEMGVTAADWAYNTEKATGTEQTVMVNPGRRGWFGLDTEQPMTFKEAFSYWNEKPNENIQDEEMWTKFAPYLRELGFSYDFNTKKIARPNDYEKVRSISPAPASTNGIPSKVPTTYQVNPMFAPPTGK